MNKERLKEIAIYLGIVILIVGGVVFYFNKQKEKLIADYTGQIDVLTGNLKDTKAELSEDIQDTEKSLGASINSVSTNVALLKEQNDRQFNTMSDLINEIEKQANLKLDQLKSEVKDIQIKSADFSAIVNDVLESVVSIKTNVGQGSGAVIRSNGYIVTNHHVINGASSVVAVTYGNEQLPVQLIGYDSGNDIAVLKVEKNLRYFEFGNSDEVKVGTKVIAAGNPAGLSFTVTEGIVSALRTGPNNLKYIQTDVPINPGNSGGPLVNQKGEIIGINNFKAAGFESLGFAIASNEVDSIVTRIIGQYEQQLAAQQAQQG